MMLHGAYIRVPTLFNLLSSALTCHTNIMTKPHRFTQKSKGGICIFSYWKIKEASYKAKFF